MIIKEIYYQLIGTKKAGTKPAFFSKIRSYSALTIKISPLICSSTSSPADELTDDEEPDAEESPYVLPPLDCLNLPKNNNSAGFENELKQNAQKLIDTLNSFGVETRIVDIARGPSVTRYEIQPAAGVKISKITNLSSVL